jgi:hypothetical protein
MKEVLDKSYMKIWFFIRVYYSYTGEFKLRSNLIFVLIRVIKSRRMRWAGHAARMGERRNAYRILVGKPEGKRPLGRPRRRWAGNIKMDLREVGWDGRD